MNMRAEFVKIDAARSNITVFLIERAAHGTVLTAQAVLRRVALHIVLLLLKYDYQDAGRDTEAKRQFARQYRPCCPAVRKAAQQPPARRPHIRQGETPFRPFGQIRFEIPCSSIKTALRIILASGLSVRSIRQVIWHKNPPRRISAYGIVAQPPEKEKMWDFFEKIKIVLDISEMVCYYNKALKSAGYIAG